jgi:hypothetical protein
LENQQGHYEFIHTNKDNPNKFIKIVDYGDIAEIKKDQKTGMPLRIIPLGRVYHYLIKNVKKDTNLTVHLYDKKEMDGRVIWERRRVVLTDWPSRSEPPSPKNPGIRSEKEQNTKDDSE